MSCYEVVTFEGLEDEQETLDAFGDLVSAHEIFESYLAVVLSSREKDRRFDKAADFLEFLSEWGLFER